MPNVHQGLIPVGAWFKAWVCTHLFAASVDYSNPPLGYGCLSLVSVVCCQVELSVTGQSVVLLSVVSLKSNLESSTMRRPRPTRTAEPWGKKNVHHGKQLVALKNA
jgi:hypothetical protein